MIRYILFDLDNTLYPESSPLGAELVRRINRFAADFLNLSEDAAQELRRVEKKSYGTTMRWLAESHGLTDLQGYIETVHPENVSDFIEKDEELKTFLRELPVPASILTNSPASHARRVLDYLEIRDCFEHVFDLDYSAFRGKPHRETYEMVLREIGHTAPEVMFVDDVPTYIEGYREIGGVAVLVDEAGSKQMSDPAVLRVRKVTEILPLLETL